MDIQQQSQLKILVIGDSCDDIYHYGECARISQEAPVPVLKHFKSEVYGGMARNVYENLASLGTHVEILTNVEKITKERFVDTRTMHHLLRFDTGESQEISTVNSKAIDDINFSDYSSIVISDYCKGFLDKDAIVKILSYCEDFNLPVFVDTKRKDMSCYSSCIIKVNQFEYEDISRHPINSEIIVTSGKSGASWNGEEFPAHKSQIDSLSISISDAIRGTNVCGAGDTFLSGLVTEYLISKDMRKSIEFANMCASKAVEKFGTYVVSMDDVI